MPIDDQSIDDYDEAEDVAAVKRMKDLGFFPPAEVDIDLDTEPFFMEDVRSQDDDDFDDDPLAIPNIPSQFPAPKPSPNDLDPIPDRSPHVGDDLHTDIFRVPYPKALKAGAPKLGPDGRPLTCESAYRKWEARWKEEFKWGSYRPFRNQMEWDICQWAKLTAPSKACVDHLLDIPNVCTFLIIWTFASFLTVICIF